MSPLCDQETGTVNDREYDIPQSKYATSTCVVSFVVRVVSLVVVRSTYVYCIVHGYQPQVRIDGSNCPSGVGAIVKPTWLSAVTYPWPS